MVRSAITFFIAQMQESNTEKILYGVDDIRGASEIIIVIWVSGAFNATVSKTLTFKILHCDLHLGIYC